MMTVMQNIFGGKKRYIYIVVYVSVRRIRPAGCSHIRLSGLYRLQQRMQMNRQTGDCIRR